MGFRFWRRIRIAPGVTLNLSQGGASVSFGDLECIAAIDGDYEDVMDRLSAE